jgi:hypothetical protein
MVVLETVALVVLVVLEVEVHHPGQMETLGVLEQLVKDMQVGTLLQFMELTTVVAVVEQAELVPLLLETMVDLVALV